MKKALRCKKTPLKKIPHFKTLDEESKFWKKNDTTDYIDWSKAKMASLPNLKPSSTTISLRLPASLLNEIKTIASKEDVPYQSLIKMMLFQTVTWMRRQS